MCESRVPQLIFDEEVESGYAMAAFQDVSDWGSS